MKELAEYDEVRKIVRQGKGTVALSGCVDSQKLHMIYGLSDGLKYKVIVTYNDLKAKEIYEEYRFYDRNVMLYPAKDLIFFQADIHGNQLVQERIKTLRRVVEGKPVTIVTTYAALMTPQVLWEEKDIIHTERGGSLDESKLASRLVAMGYEKAYQVESPGQFSVRGGIVDIFDLTEENPYRIELWGDEVESIRSFDILSQRSIEKLESITVYPATEFVLSEEQIHARIQEMGDELFDRFKDRNPMFVGVLNGCFMFMADLVRATQLKSEVEFISLSSYKNATKSSGVVEITRDLQRDITGRDIIVVEDILDSGNTLYFLEGYLKAKGAESITIVTLLDKPSRREKPITPDLAGFEVPDEFVVGFGLDYCQQYRNMPYIGVLKPEVYSK